MGGLIPLDASSTGLAGYVGFIGPVLMEAESFAPVWTAVGTGEGSKR